MGSGNAERISRTFTTQTVVIAATGTTSAEVNATGWAMFGVVLPATFTGTTLTFTVSDVSGGTYQALSDNTGTAVSMTVAQGKSYDLPTSLASWPFFKIVSGSTEGSARSLIVVKKA